MPTIEGRAVLLNEAGGPATLEEITLDPPGPGEVMIRVVASGVCHTDLTVKNLKGMGMAFPIVLGHEGAGYVEQVGEGVTHLVPGDPVVIAYRAPCELCPACRRGDPRRCYVALRPKQRIHRKRDGALCSQVLRCGTFSTMTVVHGKAAIKMPKEMPLEKACLIACGVVTGVGATFNTTPVWAGARVAVVGCGGVGLSVIQGARLSNAKQIIAVDINPTKLQWAKEFGATDVVNARGDSVLILAAYYERDEAVRVILDQPSVAIDAKNKMGFTALTGAAYKGRLGIVKQLAAKGANLNAANDRGQTSLMYAAMFGRSEVVAFLIKSRANLSIRDAQGRTALMLAQSQGNADVAALLLDAEKRAADLRKAKADGEPLKVREAKSLSHKGAQRPR